MVRPVPGFWMGVQLCGLGKWEGRGRGRAKTYPALAADEVTSLAPFNIVAAALTHGVLGIPAAVGPPGEEVAVVVPFLVLSGLASDQRGVSLFALAQEIKRRAQRAGGGRQGKCDVFERNHGCWAVE